MKVGTFRSILSTALLLAVTASHSVTAATDTMEEATSKGLAIPAKTVSLKSSELNTTEGRAAVERRIRLAAKQVCGPIGHRASGTLSLHAVARNQACYERATAEAMAQFDSGLVASTQ